MFDKRVDAFQLLYDFTSVRATKSFTQMNFVCDLIHLTLGLFLNVDVEVTIFINLFSFQAQHPGAHHRPWWVAILLMIIVQSAHGQQCPWAGAASLQQACVCAFNLAKDLSVQCDQVNISLSL